MEVARAEVVLAPAAAGGWEKEKVGGPRGGRMGWVAGARSCKCSCATVSEARAEEER